MLSRLACFLLVLLWSSSLWATTIAPAHVNLHLVTQAKSRKNAHAVWLQLCPAVAEKLLLQQGIWGHGVFQSFSCFSKNIFAGRKEKITTPWRLQFVLDAKDNYVNIQFRDKKQFHTIQRMPLSSNLKALEHADTAALVALNITLHMPFARAIDWQKDLQPDPITHTPDNITIAPPETYKVFELHFQNGAWLPTIVGSLQKVPTSPSSSPRWTLIRNNNAPQGGPYWAYADQRAEIASTLNKIIATTTSEDSSEGILDTLARGYVGVRYGVSMEDKDPLLKKSRLINIFTEVRGGPFAGLRWY